MLTLFFGSLEQHKFLVSGERIPTENFKLLKKLRLNLVMDIVADPLKIMGKIYDALNILPQKKSLKHVEVSVESLQRLSRSEYGYPIDTARVIMKIITVIASWENEVR